MKPIISITLEIQLTSIMRYIIGYILYVLYYKLSLYIVYLSASECATVDIIVSTDVR